MILTAKQGTNAELIPDVFEMYIKPGSKIADVTYGKGVFWNNIDKSKYEVLESDLQTGVDFTKLPYADESLDVVILDPPYMHSSKYGTIKDSISECYNNNINGNFGSHASVMRLYARGILEASRVLKKKGTILIKCQDEIESSKQKWSHEEIGTLLDIFGFERQDIFVLVQESVPAQRWPHQDHARKNHSYLIVAKFKR